MRWRQRFMGVMLGVLLAGTWSTGLVSTAFAQEVEPSVLEQAKSLFEQGVALGKQGLWGEAVRAFAQADELVMRPSIVFNLSSALFRVGRYAESQQQLQRYLRIAPADDAARGEAKQLEARLLKSVATLALSLEPADATVHIDGKPVDAEGGARREIPLDPGEHGLMVSAEGHKSETRSLRASRGERLDRRVALQRVTEPPHLAGDTAKRPAPAASLRLGSGEGGAAARDEGEGGDDGGGVSPSWLWVGGGALLVAGAVVAVVVLGGGGSDDPGFYGGNTMMTWEAP